MFEPLTAFVDKHEKFVVTTHVNPDCDALGSALGMSRLIEARGKSARVVNADPTPERFAFVDPENRIRTFDDSTRPRDDEVVVVVDVGDLRRLGSVGRYLAENPRPSACVDHHKSNTGFAEVNIVDANACATGLILAKLATEWRVPMTPRLASELYIAIYTDTGGFRFSNTNADTLKISARLVEAGADPSYLASEFHDRIPIGRARLFGKILAGMKTDETGKIAWVTVTLPEMESHGCDRSDIEGFVEYVRGIDTVETAVLFRESEPGKTKLSFRSRDHVDCSVLAGKFGGGGHFHAAGADLDLGLEEAVKLVLPEVEKAVNKRDAGELLPAEGGS